MLEEIAFAGDVSAGFETEFKAVKGADDISLGINISPGQGGGSMGTFMGTGKKPVLKPGDAKLAVTDLDLGETFIIEVELVGVLSDLCPIEAHGFINGITRIKLMSRNFSRRSLREGRRLRQSFFRNLI